MHTLRHRSKGAPFIKYNYSLQQHQLGGLLL